MTALLIAYLIIGVVFSLWLWIELFGEIKDGLDYIAACLVFTFLGVAWPWLIWKTLFDNPYREEAIKAWTYERT